MASKFICESKTNPGLYLELYRKDGTTGRKMWQWTEDQDLATRFENQRDLDRRLGEHHCPYKHFTYHEISLT